MCVYVCNGHISSARKIGKEKLKRDRVEWIYINNGLRSCVTVDVLH